MRGEDPIALIRSLCLRETPPHAWGRRTSNMKDLFLFGNTPTCVGKTVCIPPRRTRNMKHPHMRGEDVRIHFSARAVAETPPHAWGRPVRHVEYAGQPGNTPTCVGKTQPKGATMPRYKKHPHMRGEDSRISEDRYNMVETPPHAWGRQQPAGGFADETETPPHAWGRLRRAGGTDRLGRNTPTCVGKTARNRSPRGRTGKHPHMRGEDAVLGRRRPPRRETPPHAWGRPYAMHGNRVLFGNTPTCVGKTRADLSAEKRTQKHPHMRGEDGWSGSLTRLRQETPPHAWGRLILGIIIVALCGNTPTCVGKTIPARLTSGHVPKHPHMRGEDFWVR